MAVYATLDDLQAFLGYEPPSGAQRMLTDVSQRIDATLISSTWLTDSVTGQPTDAGVIAAFKLAACQQIEYWIKNGVDADESSNNWTSYSIEGIAVSRSHGAVQRRSRLCDAAFDTLRLTIAGTIVPRPLLPGKPTV